MAAKRRKRRRLRPGGIWRLTALALFAVMGLVLAIHVIGLIEPVPPAPVREALATVQPSAEPEQLASQRPTWTMPPAVSASATPVFLPTPTSGTEAVQPSETPEATASAAPSTAVPTASPTPEATPTLAPTPSPVSEPTPTPALTAAPVTVPAGSGRLAGLVIGIDPGHQAKGDSSKEPIAPGSSEMKMKVTWGTQGVATGVAESVVNLQVGLKLQAALAAEGATVVMTRTTQDVNISNAERAQILNNAGCDIGVRLHCNGMDDSSYTGVLMMVPDKKDIADASYAAGKLVLDEILRQTGAKSKGMMVTGTLTGFNWSTIPSILVEMGFMSNPTEDKLLCDSTYQDKIVRGIVDGLILYYKR